MLPPLSIPPDRPSCPSLVLFQLESPPRRHRGHGAAAERFPALGQGFSPCGRGVTSRLGDKKNKERKGTEPQRAVETTHGSPCPYTKAILEVPMFLKKQKSLQRFCSHRGYWESERAAGRRGSAKSSISNHRSSTQRLPTTGSAPRMSAEVRSPAHSTSFRASSLAGTHAFVALRVPPERQPKRVALDSRTFRNDWPQHARPPRRHLQCDKRPVHHAWKRW
jgi:hypothetical protein